MSAGDMGSEEVYEEFRPPLKSSGQPCKICQKLGHYCT